MHVTKGRIRNLLAGLLALAVIFLGLDETSSVDESAAGSASSPAAQQGEQLPDLVAGTQVRGSGIVERILSDDNDGSRHQRFILRLASGQTFLVAHNIDLAARVARLKIGDTIEFNGEFETNSQGGVIHWTHHDPRGQHVDGWLKHAGRTYQ